MEMCAEGYFQNWESSCFSALSNHRPVTSAGSFQSREVPKDSHSQNSESYRWNALSEGRLSCGWETNSWFSVPSVDLYSSLFLVSKVELPVTIVPGENRQQVQAGGSISLRRESSMIKAGTLRLSSSLLCILLGLWEHGMDFMGDTYLWHLRKKRRGDKGPGLGWSMAQW